MSGNDYANLVDIDPLLAQPSSDINSYIDSSTYRQAIIYAQIDSFRDSVIDAYNLGQSAASGVEYRMRGYWIAGSTYEFWKTTTPSSSPPSGHPLVSITVDGVLQ